MANYLPRRDAELLQWSKAFTQQVSDDPGAYGLTPAMATALAAVFDSFAAAYRTAITPETRTASRIKAKDTAREALEATIRPLVHIVRATPGVSDADLQTLGLRPRQAKRHRVPPPAEAPIVTLTPMPGCTLGVELQGRDTSRRGKPTDVAGATIYTHVGQSPPQDAAAWTLARNTTTPRCRVPFPTNLPPGTKVWVIACWLSPTAAPGPSSPPVYAHLAAGLRFSSAA